MNVSLRGAFTALLFLALSSCVADSAPIEGTGNNDTPNNASTNNAATSNATTNGSTGDCADRLTQCGTECIDTTVNPQNCGACGNDCADDDRATSCVRPLCVVGSCAFEQLDDGTECLSEQFGAGVCDNGSCIECVADSDCVDFPTDNDACWTASCNAGTCDYTVPDPDASCGDSTCSDGAAVLANTCGSDGTCSGGGGPVQCSPYACDMTGTSCLESCSTSADCLDGFSCDNGTCRAGTQVNATIDASIVDVDLIDWLVANTGYAAGTTLTGTVTIATGVDVGASDPTSPSLRIRPLPASSDITIVIEGRILGAGGNGGDVEGTSTSFVGLTPGQDGGTALVVEPQPATVSIRVDNRGVIGGGGGGGAAGYSKDDNDDIGTAGGGGAGYNPGAGGIPIGNLDEPSPGQPGTSTSGGAAGSWDRYAGGAGGDLGQPGLPASTSEVAGVSRGGGPGAAGLAIQGMNNFSWIAQGTVIGPTN
jgi:hypothetical protein